MNIHWASLVAQMVKNLPVTQETWLQSLGWEDLLEEGMATYNRIVAGRIPWTEEHGGHSLWGRRVLHDQATEHSIAYTLLPTCLYFV